MLYEKATKVLYIDLATGKIEIKQRTDLSIYLGGVGLASKLLDETMRQELLPWPLNNLWFSQLAQSLASTHL